MKEKSYDIKVTAGSTDYYFMLEQRGGARQFQMSPAPALPSSSPTGTPGYDNYPPQQELVYAMSDLRGGMGQLEYHADDPFAPYRYATGKSIDTRNRGRIGPGPAINTATLAGGAGAGVAPVMFEEFAGSGSRTLYIACGRYIYSWNGTNIVEVKDAGAGEAYTDLKAFATWLVGARGAADGYDFSTNGTAYTQATISGKEQTYLVVAPDSNGIGVLWGLNTPNSLRGSTDPSNAGSWAAANLIGDTVSQATGLITLGVGLFMAKDDGLYATSASSIPNWTPDFRTIRDANGFKAHTTFAGGGTRRAIVGFQRAIYEVYTTGNYKMIHPGRYGGSGLMNGNCTALAHDDEYIYAAIAGDDGDTFIAAGREETINGYTDWCWHPLIYLGANACNAMWFSNYEGGTPKLWYGKGTDICYSYMHKEPFRDDNTLPASYVLATSWELVTSWNTQRFEDVIKQYKATGTQLRNAASTRKITLSSMVDQETTWTSHGDVTTNGITQTAFPSSRTGRRIREKIAGTNSTNAATAVLESVVIKAALRPLTKRMFYYSIRCADNVGTRVGIGKKSAATIRSDIMAIINTDAQVALEHVNGTTYYVNFVRDGWAERESKDDARASTQGNETTFDVVALEAGDAASWIASPGGTLTGIALANGQFWVGNSSNIATPVAMSSEATMANTGAVTVAATHSGSAHHTRSHDHSAAGDGTALAPATLTFPGAASPAQTAEGSAVWDSDDDKLTIGTGAGRKTMMNVGDAPTAHNLVDTTEHPVSGLTTGHKLVALSATTYGFAADTKTLWIPASSFVAETGAELTVSDNYAYRIFDATGEAASATILVPKDWTSGGFTARMYCRAYVGAGNDYTITLGHLFIADGAAMNAAYTTQTHQFATGDATHNLEVWTWGTVLITAAANNMLKVRISITLGVGASYLWLGGLALDYV